MTTFQRIATTIGAAWIVAVAIATIVTISSPTSRSVHVDDGTINLHNEDVYAWGHWAAWAGILTIVALVALGVAYVWAGRKP